MSIFALLDIANHSSRRSLGKDIAIQRAIDGKSVFVTEINLVAFDRSDMFSSVVVNFEVDAQVVIVRVTLQGKQRLTFVDDNVRRVYVSVAADSNFEMIFNFPHKFLQ